MSHQMARGWHRGLRLAVGPALLVALAGCASGRLWEPTREQVLQTILPSSVQIVLEQDGRRFRSASGVVIAARPAPRGTDCFVLTSGHTVTRLSGQEKIYILFDRHRGEGIKAPATVLARRESDDLDLALLRTEASRCLAARPGIPPPLGEPIWVVAFPWGRNIKLTSGIVSQVNPDAFGDHRLPSSLMVDASVSYGSSGGGVYEARTGRLVGLIEGYGTASVSVGDDKPLRYIDVPVPGETYVTPVPAIQRFLDEAGYAELLGGRRP